MATNGLPLNYVIVNLYVAYLTISHGRREVIRNLYIKGKVYCFSINSILKNNNIYKRYVANIIYELCHSSAFESNESSCRNFVARFFYRFKIAK
jgi:hypothetical protein